MRRIYVVLLVTFVALFFVAEATARTYTTNFDNAENPLSEGGNWVNGGVNGTVWANVKTLNGAAHGTQSSASRQYSDSTSLVSGTWGNDQTVTAMVQLGAVSAQYPEVEIRLRSEISPNVNRGYEILFSVLQTGSYIQIVRWNGPLGDFTYLNDSCSSVRLSDGDVVKASMIGTTIRAYVNDGQVCQASDSTYSSGKPGIGFYLESNWSAQDNFGFKDFTATDGVISPSKTPRSPTNLRVSP